jgi:hypothetical protein
MTLPRLEKDRSMNLRPVIKPLAALLLTFGLVTVSVAPADAAPAKKAPTYSTYDTGWGIR